MNVTDLLKKARFVVDSDGKRTAVLLDRTSWEELLILLEDLGNARPQKETKAGLDLCDRSQRPFGLCAGQFTVPDDFDDPLPEHVLKEFEGRG